MVDIQNNISNDLKPNKKIKIKYEISKPSYLIPSNANKLFKNLAEKTSNNSHIPEKVGLTPWNKNNLNNNKKNLRFDKKQNSMKKRMKDKDNKNKLKPKSSIEKKKPNNNNNIISPRIALKSPSIQSKNHKRINSLHINGKENYKNPKINIKKGANSNSINYNRDKINDSSVDRNAISIDQYINQKESLNNNNYISKNNDIENLSLNNLSYNSENKKSAKCDNTILNKIYNPIRVDEIEKSDLYFSFNKNTVNNNNYISNLSDSERTKINLKKNSKINNNTISGKIASRAKNLNKMLEENFKNLKIERKEKEKEKDKEKEKEKDKDKDKSIKNEENNINKNSTFNSKNISINELVFNSINNNNGKNNHNSKFIKQKENKTLSSDLIQKKQKMQHKTASLNRSLELRKKSKINDNFIHNGNSNNTVEKKPMTVFSKNDFRQMNTSPFVRSKPPMKPKQTNNLPRKTPLTKNNNINNNMKIIDKKYKSPQKDLNHVKDFISLEPPTKDNNGKKAVIPKKKKIVTKRKNKSMIIDNKLKEKEINIDKIINEEKKDNNINSKNEKQNKNNNNSLEITSKKEKEKPINIKQPIRAQSQQEINTELILNNINEILEKNQKENLYLKKSEKKILKLQTLCKKGFAGPGIKKTNQDNFFIYNNFNNNPNNLYLGVCDGHGMFGQDVSGYLVNTLPQNMNINLLSSNINLSTESLIKLEPIIISTFNSTNVDMTQDERVDSSFSGSTCVSLFFTPNRLICANVGDSRCILGKYDGNKWKSKNLSRDQKPSEKDEYERVIKSGGRIESFKDENGNFIGPERVWLKDEDVPGLAMSRSFGDEIAHTVGVITEPEINEYFFLKEDKFIIIASDGLWEFISSEECVEMVKEFYLKNDIEGALNYLYKESSKRWIMEEEVIDDITILMAFLN